MKSKTKPSLKNTSEIERIKLDLLSLVSHELRTPLSSVLNAVRVLREGDLSVNDREKFLDMAYRNAERLNNALSQLLDLSRLVSGRLVCRFHEVSLKHMVLTQVEQLETLCASQDLKVSESINASDLPVILADGPRLEQVFRALIENAVKFSPPHGKVTFRARHVSGENDSVVFEISNQVSSRMGDPGAAIEVFKIFAQREAVLERTHEGVGGSLAIASEIVKQHGGTIEAHVESKSEGNVFTIRMTLPVLESDEALKKVLESRLFGLKNEPGAVSLLLVQVEGARQAKQLVPSLKAALFRASDSVYPLSGKAAGQVAVVMDDCKKADAPKILKRLIDSMGAETAKILKAKTTRIGLASSPDDALDPEKLIESARKSFTEL